MIDLGFFSISIILAFFTAGMVLLSVLVNGLLLKFSSSLGSKNEENQVRWAPTSKPAFGGVSFYILFLISIVFYSIFFPQNELLLNKQFLGFILAISLGFIMGLADDAYNTKPLLKFSVQFICGFTFVLTDNVIHIFPWESLNVFITFFWVVGLMNSINMLDNMDAITSSVSLVICSGALMYMAFRQLHVNLDFILILGVSSTLIGFLYFNWNPSRIYMGDSGSQFLGIFLAGIGIKYFWNAPGYYGDFSLERQIVIALLMFVVPISDTASVSINRMLKGKSPFVGGRDHTTHHLSYLGLSDRYVAVVMILLSLLTMITAIFVFNNVKQWNSYYTICGVILFILIFAGLYSTTRLKKVKSEA
ncbi:MAG: glycosyltransferase family 4 protein [Bacteroidia bacterium]